MVKKTGMKVLWFLLALLIPVALVSYASGVWFDWDLLLWISFGNVLAHQIIVGIAGVLGLIGVISLIFGKK